MPEKFDFSTKESQQNFKRLDKQMKKEMVDNNHDTANRMQELTDKDSLRKDYDAAHELIDEQKDKEKEAIKKDFDRYMKDKFSEIPDGCRLASDLEGVDSILINKPEENGNQIHVSLRYRAENGKDNLLRSFTFTITNGGSLLDAAWNRPKELTHLSEEEIFKEVIADCKALNLGDPWLSLPGSLLPPGSWDFPEGDGSDWNQDRPQDSNRIEHFAHFPGLLLKGYPKKDARGGGLKEYQLFVFKRGAIFENATCENGIYYFTFDSPVSDDLADKLKNKTFTSEELSDFYEHSGINREKIKHKKELIDEGKKYGGRYGKHANKTTSKDSKWWKKLDNFIEQTLA